jgi:hypothetical protein
MWPEDIAVLHSAGNIEKVRKKGKKKGGLAPNWLSQMSWKMVVVRCPSPFSTLRQHYLAGDDG